MKPFISLCMIVKNEEKVLERCLRSAAHLVDEVIIVDTGSTDKTKEIAATFTSNIFDFTWIDDFSAARNFAGSKASGDWIVVLDADEYVDEDNFEIFIQELKEDQNQFDAYSAKILNFTGNFGESLIQNNHDRVYKNNNEIMYYRKIHEQFKHITNKPLNIKKSSLLIFHSGYLNQVVQEKDKGSRNSELIGNEMNSGQNNAFDNFNLGNEYASKGDYSKALEYYLEAYKGKTDFRMNWVSIALIQIIICLMQLKRYKDALTLINDAENMYTSSAEVPFLKGEIFFLRRQLEEAKQSFEQIVANPDQYSQSIFRPDMKDQKPHLRLAEIYFNEEDYSKAIYHYTSVLNINKYEEESIKKVITILSKFHNNDEIVNFLQEKSLVNQKNIQSYVKSCINIGNPDLSLRLLEAHIENNKLFYKISLFKKLCIENEGNIKEFLEFLESQLFIQLVEKNWINPIDILLLRDNLIKTDNNLIAQIEHLDKIDSYRQLADFYDGKKKINELDSQLISDSLKTLLVYKKYSLINVLLENIESTDKNNILNVARVLYMYGFKVEALQLYEKTDWANFNNQDFINIINSLLETDNKESAVTVSQYAVAMFADDYRFYKYILENTNNEELYKITVEEANDIFF